MAQPTDQTQTEAPAQPAAAPAEGAKGAKATPMGKKDTVKAGKKNPMTSTQMHMQIAEIRDNVIILKNGGVRAILKTSSMNVHLKSEEEQNSVIYSYQNFLNTLEFPIQIVVRSKKLDLDTYLDSLKDIAKKQTHSLLKEQTVDYIDYINRLIEYADIMQKEFYVVVPFDPARAKKPTLIQKFMQRMTQKDSVGELNQRHREFETLYKGLTQRLNVIASGLQNCGLKADQLKTDELVTLFYECYNPRTSQIQKFKKSGELAVDQDSDIHKEEKSDDDDEVA
jgi:hypothetical protein